MTLRDHLKSGRARLVAAGIHPSEAARDAALLARHALGWDAATLLMRDPDPAPPEFEAAFASLLDRRMHREPVAYIRGEQEFWGRAFAVSPAVLIPRPETELIIDEALAHLRPPAPPHSHTLICDIGTGSGCLAVTLAVERSHAHVVATDISADALSVARANAERHGVAGRIEFRKGSYLAGATGRFDLIVANPPYITDADYSALAPEVRDFEPKLALAAGPDGLRDIRDTLTLAAAALAPSGVLLMEIGYTQAPSVRSLVSAIPALTLREIVEDLQHIPRIVVAQHL